MYFFQMEVNSPNELLFEKKTPIIVALEIAAVATPPPRGKTL
jgi:hypothetical protein